MAPVYFTLDHEWLRVEGEIGTCGITDYAQKQLGDVVFVELPTVGNAVQQGDQAAVVESVKAASEVYAPVSGEVTAINDALADEPALVNQDPLGDGWFFSIRLSDSAELSKLLDAEAYEAHVKSLD